LEILVVVATQIRVAAEDGLMEADNGTYLEERLLLYYSKCVNFPFLQMLL
jgi:hypothetical protein